jgi:hypothetical protein
VQARLEERPRARWSGAWLVLPAAAAAMVALILVIPREQAPDQQASQMSSRIENRSAPKEVSAAEPPPRVPVKAATPPRQASRAVTADRRALEFAPDVVLEAIAIAPVAVAPLDVNALAGAPPIALDAIAVEPLEILNSGQ